MCLSVAVLSFYQHGCYLRTFEVDVTRNCLLWKQGIMGSSPTIAILNSSILKDKTVSAHKNLKRHVRTISSRKGVKN